MREKKKNTPFLKKSPGEKSNTPLFLQFSGRTLSHEKYPLPDILATRMRSFRPLSGGGPGLKTSKMIVVLGQLIGWRRQVQI